MLQLKEEACVEDRSQRLGYEAECAKRHVAHFVAELPDRRKHQSFGKRRGSFQRNTDKT
jgi:hypothetical protein